MRADITEGLPGAPLALVLQVVDTECRPIEGARVDVWHCDAAGNYSGYARQGSDRTRDTRGETFMRGTQFADARGVATFRTVWPGWYRGRTPHVHYKVFLDEATLLTSQLFFPDGASEAVFQATPYRGRAGTQDTTNATDGIARRAGPRAFARVAQADGGWRAELVIGVMPGQLMRGLCIGRCRAAAQRPRHRLVQSALRHVIEGQLIVRWTLEPVRPSKKRLLRDLERA